MDPAVAIPRARAAWAYARLSQRELADKTGLSYDRVRALLGSTHSGREPSIDELRKVADACGVPRDFMDHGFASSPALTAEDVKMIVQLELAARGNDDASPGAGRQEPNGRAG